ncbi:MAG TPA: glycine cleavage T C-terminal barrel domain-containing protein [Vicinamibacterales bacterium]|nr:glycine cleavage T C-terminal barrel domain-containing protein [Vicinamibacterales bacterium]
MTKDNSRGYEAFSSGAALVRRADVGRLLVTGADRRTYLQGLLTNDIAALTPGTGCYAAMLNAQGRMMSDMYVDELGDAVLLRVPIALTTHVRDHLERFVFSEDVQVADVTAQQVQLGLYGPRAADTAAAVGRARRLAIDDLEGQSLLVADGEMDAVAAELLAAGAAAATLDDFEIARIEAGRPRFGVDMDTDTIPLEAGIEDRAISRTKGCYVGQEVIIRVLDRGHGRVAKRLVPLEFDAGAPVPVHGAVVRSGDRDVGRVTSAAFSPRLDRVVALAYLHRDFTSARVEVSVDGARATVRVTPSSSE